MSGQPRVTVGVPVHDGAALLPRALDSLLAQEGVAFRVVISDNASTDDTPAIAQRYASADPRVTFVRNEQNRGAAWNFRRVFDGATTDYLLWLAHDDVLLPGYLARTVARLDDDPTAVICHSAAQPITADGTPLGESYLGWVVDEPTPEARLRHVLEDWRVHAAVYGLLRRSAMERTRGWRGILGADVVFVAEMSLQGRVVQLPDVLQLKTVPAPGDPYMSPAELTTYVMGRRTERRSLMQRLWISGEIVHAIFRAGFDPRRTWSMTALAAGAYVRRGLWLIDLRETGRLVLRRAGHWRQRSTQRGATS